MNAIYFILLAYLILNFLMFWRVCRLLRLKLVPKLIVYFVGAILTTGYVSARKLHGLIPGPVTDFIHLAACFWMVAFVYLLMIWLALEVVYFILRRTGKWESLRSKLPRTLPQMVVGAAVLFTAMIITAGYVNNLKPVVRTFVIPVDKAVSENQTLRVVVAADMHLGKIIDGARAEQFVRLINEQKPDMVFLPGDIIDINTREVAANGGAAALGEIEAPLGVFACLGNHEFYAGEAASTALLEEQGISVLRDEFINLANGLQIAGRLDYARVKAGLPRKPLREIVGQADPDMPLPLLDHQPVAVEEAREAGVDLLVSGHTHNGQFWPFNHVVKMLFDIPYGYARRGAMQVYVSNGLGTWGPPVRIGLPPEIVVLELRFREPLTPDDTGEMQ